MANDRILPLYYNTLTPYEHDPALIKSDGANALLNLIPRTSRSFVQDFASDVGFTYNPALLEFITGTLQKVDQLPETIKNHNFEDGADMDGSSIGFKGGTLLNDAEVSDGVLKIENPTDYWQMDEAAIAELDLSEEFTYNTDVIIKDGNPAITQYIVQWFESGSGNFKNRTEIFYYNGELVFRRFNSTGSAAKFVAVEIELTPLQKYNIEVYSSKADDEMGVLVNGVLIGTENLLSVQTNLANFFRIGDPSASYESAFNIDSFHIYETVQHTEDFAPVELPICRYTYARASLPTFNYPDIGNILFWESIAATLVEIVKFNINGLWYDGAGWVTSNGSVVESNTLAEVQSYINLLPVSDSVDIDVIFPDSNVKQSISSLQLFYIGQQYKTTPPPWIMVADGTFVDGVGEIIVSGGTPAGTSFGFNPNVNHQDYWYDGNDWVIGNGTVAQSNTEAEFNANISKFAFGSGKVFKLKVWLITTDENETPLLASIFMTYDFSASPNYPLVCKMYGFITNLSSVPVKGAEITFSADDFYSGHNLVTKNVVVESVENGFYDVSLVRTITLDRKITQTVRYTEDSGAKAEFEDFIIVPNEEVAPIADNLAS